MSPYDKEHIGAIIAGHGDWFTAQLLRLISKADLANRSRLQIAFPEEVQAYELWENGENAFKACGISHCVKCGCQIHFTEKICGECACEEDGL